MASEGEDPALAQLDDAALLARACAETDEDRYWQLVQMLHRRGTTSICERSIRLCASDDPTERATAADVLGQLGWDGRHPYAGVSLAPLIGLLGDGDDSVVSCAVAALGHLGDANTLEAILGVADHPSSDVRFSIATAVSSLLGVARVASSHPGVLALIRLTTDEDSDVRDWATFGLGSQTNTDGDGVRAALFDRLDDADPDTRGEALVGLAARRDPRALDRVIRALESGDDLYRSLTAAARLGSVELLATLRAVAPRDDFELAARERAVRRCDPREQAREVVAIDEFLALAPALLSGVDVGIGCELFSFGDGGVQVTVTDGDVVETYQLERLLERAGSVAAAAALIAEDRAARVGATVRD